MTTTRSQTKTETFTRTDTKELASRIAADLNQVRRFYEVPSKSTIEDYRIELRELLLGPWVDEVKYGFSQGGEWLWGLRYDVKADGSITSQDDPGDIPPDKNVEGANWASFLYYTHSWYEKPSEERESILEDIPISRTVGEDPISNSMWDMSKSYSRKHVGVERSQL